MTSESAKSEGPAKVTKFGHLVAQLVNEHVNALTSLEAENHRLQRLLKGLPRHVERKECECKEMEEATNDLHGDVLAERMALQSACGGFCLQLHTGTCELRLGEATAISLALLRNEVRSTLRSGRRRRRSLTEEEEEKEIDRRVTVVQARVEKRMQDQLADVFDVWARHSARRCAEKLKVEFVVRAPWDEHGGDGTSALDNIATMNLNNVKWDMKEVDRDKQVQMTGIARYMISPSSTKRICWDLAGAVLLFYDMIMIPMLLFDYTPNSVTISMDWFTQIFWTVDCFASCMTGYISHGLTVMNPRLALIHYLKTWFLLDMMVVIPDWVGTILAAIADEGGSQPGDTSKLPLLRALRVLRIARLLRLAKLTKLLNLVKDRIDSEVTFVLVNILKLITMLLIVNHFLAALWYGIGTVDPNRSWTAAEFAEDNDIMYRYTTAYHWSLTQFTPGSMSVQPCNLYERSFALLVLVLGLVLFSSFISSITASITQLRGMSEERSKQLWLLRRYLRQRQMSKQLSFRVLRYIEYALGEQKDLVTDKRIWVLGYLSKQLRDELDFEVSYRCVSCHPFFHAIMEESELMMSKLVGKALSLRPMGGGELLYKACTKADYMYTVVTGELGYKSMNSTFEPETEASTPFSAALEGVEKVRPNDWLCEGVLWTSWDTRGTTRALQESKLVQIEANKFCEVVGGEVSTLSLGRSYSKNYLAHLFSLDYNQLTDVTTHDQVSSQTQFLEQQHHPELGSAPRPGYGSRPADRRLRP